MKTMLILGGDRIARSALSVLKVTENLSIVIDQSTDIKRVARLIIKKRLPLLLVIKMLFCEIKRPKPLVFLPDLPVIKSNKDLLALIGKIKPERIVLFRAGLVISKDVISIGIPLLNIHCAKLPEYSGLGSIYRAIRDNAIEQFATLHRVTTTIDEGEVFDIEPFRLDLENSYCFNEDIAYQAGIVLLKRTIGCHISDLHKQCPA